MQCVRCGRKLRKKDEELCYKCRQEFAFAIHRSELYDQDSQYVVFGMDYDCACSACALFHSGRSSQRPYHPNQKPNIAYIGLRVGYNQIEEIERPVYIYD